MAKQDELVGVDSERMTPSSAEHHSFVIRFGLEEAMPDRKICRWSGIITHYPGGEELRLRNIGDILEIVRKYLEYAGLEIEIV